MRMSIALFTALAMLGLSISAAQTQEKKGDANVSGVLNFKMKSIDGKDVDLAQYKGKVVMLVNVASRCGYTKWYTGLQATYAKYKDQGFVVIGVPANEFGKQEPGTDEEIVQFCSSKYNVTFPMLSKVVVKGEGQVPLYKYLTSEETNPKFGGEIKWNFTRFLIGRNGEIVNRFEPKVNPESPEAIAAIEAELAKK